MIEKKNNKKSYLSSKTVKNPVFSSVDFRLFSKRVVFCFLSNFKKFKFDSSIHKNRKKS